MQDRRTATVPALSSKRQIETQLHAQLEASRIKYESASEAYKSALKDCDDVRLTHRDGNGNGNGNGTSQPKVGQSISEAVKAQHDAFEGYRRALDTFNKFILYGDLPEQPDSN
jgi:hypothetical protein